MEIGRRRHGERKLEGREEAKGGIDTRRVEQTGAGEGKGGQSRKQGNTGVHFPITRVDCHNITIADMNKALAVCWWTGVFVVIIVMITQVLLATQLSWIDITVQSSGNETSPVISVCNCKE